MSTRDFLLIHDPAIDENALAQAAADQAAQRAELPPLACSLGRAKLSAERERLQKTLKDLQERVRDCGIVETHQTGWKGTLDLFIKRRLRFLFQRHLLQQYRMNLKVLTTLKLLVQYLEDADRLVRQALDLAEQKEEATAAKVEDLAAERQRQPARMLRRSQRGPRVSRLSHLE